jgi:hypothetical protein
MKSVRAELLSTIINIVELPTWSMLIRSFKRTEQYWNYKEWQYDFYNEKKDDEVDLDTGLIEDVYEEEYHVKMKHNRLVIYPSYLWHSAVMAPGMFKDNPRVSLSGFIKSDYFI